MIAAIIVLSVLLAASLLLMIYTYVRIFYSPEKYNNYTFDLTPKSDSSDEDKLLYNLSLGFAEAEFEEVYIKSFDSTTLYARYYHTNDNAPIYIQFHGYRSSAMRDFSGGFKTVIDRGHNTLVVDQRAHGKSEGNKITFGIYESRDCLCWIDYVNKRFGEKTDIFLAGVSMGASTVLMAAGYPLPKNVKGVFADCGYSSAKEIIMKVCRDEGFPPKLVYPFIHLGALVFGGFNPSKESAVDAVARSEVPILIIHGDKDGFVPCDMAKQIFSAAKGREGVYLEIFEGAPHGYSYLKDPEKYTRIGDEFVKACLGK